MDFSENALKFPLTWHGRLVVHAGTKDVEDSVMRVFTALGVTAGAVLAGNVSSKGTYATWQLQCTVQDIVMLRSLFTALESLPGVKMLI